MKKSLSILLVALLSVTLLAGCKTVVTNNGNKKQTKKSNHGQDKKEEKHNKR